MKKAITLIVILAFTAFYTFILRASMAGSSQLLRVVLYNIPPLIAVGAGVYTSFSFGMRGLRAKSITLITLGIFFWLLGEIVFYIYSLEGLDPFPSFADLFYILGYPLLFTGLLFELKLADVKLKDIDKPILFLLGGVGILIALIVSYFGIYLVYDPAVSILQNSFAIGYGVMDMTILLLSLVLALNIWVYKGSRIVMPWLYFLLAMLATLIADVLFAIFTDIYDVNVNLTLVMDLLWMASYAMFSYTFILFVLSSKRIQNKINQVKN